MQEDTTPARWTGNKGGYSIRYHARRQAKEQARDTTLSYAEARRLAWAEAEQLPGVGRYIYIHLWEHYRQQIESQRALEAILREADTWD